MAPEPKARSRNKKGKVLSEEDGLPVVGATIIVEDPSNIRTITDNNGNFQLSDVPKDSRVRISYVRASGKGCPSGRSTKATRRNRRGTKLRAVCTAGIARGAGRAWTIAPAMCLS